MKSGMIVLQVNTHSTDKSQISDMMS